MNVPGAEDLLRVWEQSHGAHPIRRALALLDAASPEIGGDAWVAAPVGQRDARLIEIYETLFGPRLQMVTRCPRCAEALESSFAARDMLQPVSRATHEALELRAHGCGIKYRLPNSEDLLEVCAMDADRARHSLLQRCIIEATVAGERSDVEHLPSEAVQRLTEEMSKQDPAADIQIELRCPACGYIWSACFDIVTYLWSELDDWAQRTLADVNALARAYGWSEREILGLSPTRRRHYLELVQS